MALDSLTSLRFVAALAAVLFHIGKYVPGAEAILVSPLLHHFFEQPLERRLRGARPRPEAVA